MLVGAGALVALIFGLWLVHLTHSGLGTGWVSGALALLIVVAGLGGIGGQVPKRARLLARRLGRVTLRPRSCARCSTTLARA